MARTTILVQDDLLLDVRRVAKTRGVTLTEVVNTALKAYVDTQPRPGLPSFTGIGRSKGPGSGTLGRNAKRLAARAIDPHEGSAREGRR